MNITKLKMQKTIIFIILKILEISAVFITYFGICYIGHGFLFLINTNNPMFTYPIYHIFKFIFGVAVLGVVVAVVFFGYVFWISIKEELIPANWRLR